VGKRAARLAEDPAHRLAVTDQDERSLAEHPQREDVSVVPSAAVQEGEWVCAHLDQLAYRTLPWACRQRTVHDLSSGNHPVIWLFTNGDLVEDITWRFTFPVDSAGVQHVVVAELTGREATDRNAPGRIITPPNAPVGEVLEVERGIKIFADPRTGSFFNFLPFPITLANALNEGFFPDLAALFPPTDFFMNQIVRSVLVEAPAEITGLRRLSYWATTAIYDQGHGWVQLQRAGGPNGTTLWNFPAGSAGFNINATVPSQDLAGRPAHPETDPATGVWGQIRD
jgi:hypothetical protein